MEQPVATVPPPEFKDCRICKRKSVIPGEDSRRSCERCREQRKKYSQQKRIRDREKASLLLSSNKAEKEIAKEPGEANLEAKKQKRKHASSVDLPGSPSSKKLKKKKLSVKTPWTEYQTADGLYEALRDSMASSLLPDFRGRFSIVMDLKVDHLKRASAVVHNLRTVAKCPIATVPRSVTKSNYVAETRYACACLANANQSTASTTRPNSIPLQNSHGSNGNLRADEKNQANVAKLAEALQASFTMDCGGSVRITVETDSSHPLDVPGQRISIVLKH